jgi:ATP-dependent RNA helicase DDX51/DBP6
LLAQSFQDWLAHVLAATRPDYNHQKPAHKEDDEYPKASQPLSNLVPDGLAPSFLNRLPHPHFSSFFLERKVSSCQKLLFSATLTRDPGKISALELRNPKYFIVQGSENETVGGEVLDVVMEKFSMPSTLKVC